MPEAARPAPSLAWVTTAATSLRIAAGGSGSARVVMLHEIGGALETWNLVAARLGRRFRTLAYDQRGAGHSEKIRGSFAVDTHVHDLAALLAKLGESAPVHLAGVALGSAIAVRFAALYPARVRSLVLASPALSAGGERKAYLHARAAKVEAEGMRAVVAGTLASSWPAPARGDPALLADYEARYRCTDPTSYAALNRAFAGFDGWPDLAAIACPTLVIGGVHDGLRPPGEVKAVADGIAGARCVMLAAGHIIPLQAPEAMSDAMDDFYDGLA